MQCSYGWQHASIGASVDIGLSKEIETFILTLEECGISMLKVMLGLTDILGVTGLRL